MRFAALRRLGLRKTAVGLAPFVRFSPPHFFAPVKMLRIFPYRAQKTSHTAGTLCAIPPKFIEGIIDKKGKKC
jgi:hypothetical protein